MENTVCYYQCQNENAKYRVEFSNDETAVSIHSMRKDENGEFKDTGNVYSLSNIQPQSLGLGWKVFVELRNVMAAEMEKKTEYYMITFTNFETSQTADNGDVHSFTWDNKSKRLDEFKNGKPFNKSAKADVQAATEYALQMLQIYIDEPVYTVKSSEVNNVMFGVYANAANNAYRVFGYREENSGLSIVNGETALSRYSDVNEAIDDAKLYAFPDENFDKFLGANYVLDERNQAVTLTIVYEQDGATKTESESYSFKDYCDGVGLDYELDYDEYAKEFDAAHRKDRVYDESCNAVYYTSGNGHYYDLDEAYQYSQEEHVLELFEDERDNFLNSEETHNALWENISLDVNFSPLDIERFNKLHSENIAVIPNPLIAKEKAQKEATQGER